MRLARQTRVDGHAERVLCMRLGHGIEWHVRDVDVQSPQGQLHPGPAELCDTFVRTETVMGMREVLEPCL